nr:hypothetical protein 4 [Legionellales bacterium]
MIIINTTNWFTKRFGGAIADVPAGFIPYKWKSEDGSGTINELTIPECDKKYWKIENEEVVEMDAGEKAVVDSAELDAAKDTKILAIDSRTRQLIFGGFDYNGSQFSLSLEAQTNWNTLRIEILDEANPEDAFPLYVTTLDNSEYTIPDYAEFKAIYKAGKKKKKDYIDDGRALKIQVKQADTVAEVEAIIDTRT